LINRKTHHAVEADTGKDKGDDAEDREEHSDHPVTGEDVIVKLRGRPREIRREI
jgi:hypothetical protein